MQGYEESNNDNFLDVGQWEAPAAIETLEQNIHNLDNSEPVNYGKIVNLLWSLPRDWVESEPKWFKVAGILCDIDPIGLYPIFVEWSKQCREKFDLAACEDRWQRARNHRGTKATIGTLIAAARESESESVESAEPTFRLIKASELLTNNFTVDYLVEDILVKRQPAMLAGPLKALKTSNALDLAVSLATGEPFLGKFKVNEQQKVFFMSGESGEGTLSQTFKDICEAKGATPSDDYFVMSPDLPYLGGSLDALRAVLVELGTEVLFIDPCYLCMDGADAGNVFQMGPQLRNLATMCSELGITPILLHHAIKHTFTEYRPLELTDMAWSGFAEFARQWILVSRRKAYVDGTGEHRLFFRAGGSAKHSGLFHVDVDEYAEVIGGKPTAFKWAVSVQDSQAANAAAKAESQEQQFEERVSILRKAVADWPLTKTDICNICCLPGKAEIRSKFIQELFAAGVVLPKDGQTVNGRGTVYQLVIVIKATA